MPISYESELPRIRVLLVDDHAMVRQGLRSLLDRYSDIEIVGEASNGEEAIAAAAVLNPTIVVMDINMPKMNGIDATAAIKARFQHMIVIGVSVHVGDANAEAMRRAGASMLLTKEAAVEELYQTIERVLRETGQLASENSNEPIVSLEDPRPQDSTRFCDSADKSLGTTPYWPVAGKKGYFPPS
jgi:DNA-binding NarL/FixJ family response regulator